MFCAKCGTQVGETASFCQSCGTNISERQTAASIEYRPTSQPVTSKKQGTVYVVLGWIFFAMSLLFIPLLFGAGAFIMGFMTYRVRSQVHGVIIMVFSVVGALLGTLLGIIIGSMMY